MEILTEKETAYISGGLIIAPTMSLADAARAAGHFLVDICEGLSANVMGEYY